MFLVLPGSPVLGGGGARARDSDGDGLTDRFEIRYHLDPARRDSDRDGVFDGSEDADGDGLSALGEQRSGTSPLRPDTDGDGTRDGRDDADHDGIPDGLEQDRRPLPRHLRPTLAGAHLDRAASYEDGCHGHPSEATMTPCVYGDAAGTTTVVLLGDSHAAQWLPAFDRIGRHAHWRIVSITHSSCPAPDLVAPFATMPEVCGAWREAALDWVIANPPDLVVLVGARRYELHDADGKVLPPAAALDAWKTAWAGTVGHLSGLRVLDLADTPEPRTDVPACLLARRLMQPCTTRRSVAVAADWEAAEQAAVEALGAGFSSPADLVCPYDPCPVVDGDVLIYRDSHHLTATIARTLAPSIRAILEAALTDLGPARARASTRHHHAPRRGTSRPPG
ncbi:MAG: SGNH hydrolase domain-containing protein [Chloroflexota bacterium]